MKLLLLLLGVAVIVLNLFLWHSKRQTAKTKAAQSSKHKNKLDDAHTRSEEFTDRSDLAALKQSAASELCISIEELERMPLEEIEELAVEKGLIDLSEKTS